MKLHAKSLDIYGDITEFQRVRHIADGVRERSIRVAPRKRCGGTAGARGVMGEAHIAAGAAEAAGDCHWERPPRQGATDGSSTRRDG